ncbi:MAG: restriction endonuclease subunit S [Methanobacteriota archaeon]
MEGHNKTEIGNFPNDWNVGRIDDFFEIQQGKQVSKSNRVGENQKPFLRTSNIYWGKVVFEELDYMNFSKDEEARYRLKKNDLLVCEGGDIGRTAIWNQEVENCYYQNHLHRLRAKTDDIDPLFILQWLEYSFVIGKVYFGRANVTTIPNLSKSRLSELIIPHPPLPEQRKIAHVLSTVQKAIEQQDNLIRTTTELKKSLMQKLFTEGTRGELQKETEIGLVPESWEVIRIGDIMKITSGGTPSRKNKEYYAGDILWVKSGELEDNIILNTEEKITEQAIKESSAKLFPLKTLLIAMYGATVGKTSILEKEAATNQAVCAILPNEEIFNQEFLRHYFITIRENLLKQRYGGAQPNISQTIIKNTLVPKPNIKEQNAIADSMTLFDSKICYHKSKKDSLTALFKTLLHELMTGQRRVHKLGFEALVKDTTQEGGKHHSHSV